MIDREPTISVGIMDAATGLRGEFETPFMTGSYRSSEWRGGFAARAEGAAVVVTGAGQKEFRHEGPLTFDPVGGGRFILRDVTIGVKFHWERKEDQTFEGALRLVPRGDGTLSVINQVPLEAYLASVISSEMSATAPAALLEAHAITSRSWLVAMLQRAARKTPPILPPPPGEGGEVVRWYTREDHDVYDVCADDHCQRYQGVSKIISRSVDEAIKRTRGLFLVFGDEVCDARFYKACGGLTDEFHLTWEPVQVPYLHSVSDASRALPPVHSEEEARRWILSSPEVFCNTTDGNILRQVLPSFDQETTDFFRWTVTYPREDLEAILREKSGIDFGTLMDIVPLHRGPSGRITRCRIVGTERTVVVGKELEIRRWLSKSHLYSSAFFVTGERERTGVPTTFRLQGAGWGHGVGLCQIGAAVMAVQGFSPEQIVTHYFPGAALRRLY
jgi:stage II sporulation protein D